MPGFAERVRKQAGLTELEAFALPDELVEDVARPYILVPSGRAIGTPEPLFGTITTDVVDELRMRYSGNQKADMASHTASAPGHGNANNGHGDAVTKKMKEKK